MQNVGVCCRIVHDSYMEAFPAPRFLVWPCWNDSHSFLRCYDWGLDGQISSTQGPTRQTMSPISRRSCGLLYMMILNCVGLQVIQTSLALQNISIFGASIAILVLLVQPWPTVNKSFKLFGGLILAVNVLGGVSALASLATKVSLERDW